MLNRLNFLPQDAAGDEIKNFFVRGDWRAISFEVASTLCVRAWAHTRSSQALGSNIRDDAVCIHRLATLWTSIALGNSSATVKRAAANDLCCVDQQLLANQALQILTGIEQKLALETSGGGRRGWHALVT
jgi:hypothetical protein